MAETASRTRSERGAAVVEYALVLPIFLLLTIGSLEVFRLLSVQQTLRTAVQQALPCVSHWCDVAYYRAEWWGEACPADPTTIIEQRLRANPFARRPRGARGLTVTIWPDPNTLTAWCGSPNPEEWGTVFEFVATVEVALGFLYPLPGGPTITLRESAWTFLDCAPRFYNLADTMPFPHDPGALP